MAQHNITLAPIETSEPQASIFRAATLLGVWYEESKTRNGSKTRTYTRMTKGWIFIANFESNGAWDIAIKRRFVAVAGRLWQDHLVAFYSSTRDGSPGWSGWVIKFHEEFLKLVL